MDYSEFLEGMILGKYIILRKEVKKQKTSGCIYVPMDLVGREVLVIVKSESNGSK